MLLFTVAAAIVAAKLLVYALYARALNRRFGTTHHPFVVSGVRLLLSLAFTAANLGLFTGLAHLSPGLSERLAFSPLPLLTAILFAMLAWHIVLRVFFAGPSTPPGDLRRALVIGTLISAVMAIGSFVLAMFGLMHNIRMC